MAARGGASYAASVEMNFLWNRHPRTLPVAPAVALVNSSVCQPSATRPLLSLVTYGSRSKSLTSLRSLSAVMSVPSRYTRTVAGTADVVSPLDERVLVGLSDAERAADYRLACRARVQGDVTVTLAPIVVYSNKMFRACDDYKKPGVPLGLAIDLGSTTVAAFVTTLTTGDVCAGAAALNQQTAFGAAVIDSDEAALQAMFGANFRQLSPPAGAELRYEFIEAWAKSHKIEPDGDGRALLNLIEQVAAWKVEGTLTRDQVAQRLMRRAAKYDKSGDEHYNLISALHKSVRGSDPDAALYWFARMLELSLIHISEPTRPY